MWARVSFIVFCFIFTAFPSQSGAVLNCSGALSDLVYGRMQVGTRRFHQRAKYFASNEQLPGMLTQAAYSYLTAPRGKPGLRYRGLALTERELQDILKNGLSAEGFFRDRQFFGGSPSTAAFFAMSRLKSAKPEPFLLVIVAVDPEGSSAHFTEQPTNNRHRFFTTPDNIPSSEFAGIYVLTKGFPVASFRPVDQTR